VFVLHAAGSASSMPREVGEAEQGRVLIRILGPGKQTRYGRVRMQMCQQSRDVGLLREKTIYVLQSNMDGIRYDKPCSDASCFVSCFDER